MVLSAIAPRDGTRPYFLKDTETPVVCQFQPSLKCRPPLYRESAAFQTGSNSWFYDGVHFPYGLMIGIRQGIINLIAAVLYHAFEQQGMFFHRKNVLNYNEENDPKLFTIPKFKRRLQHLGIKIDDLASWQKIEELRLVANTVKHAEGGSSHKLRDIRSDLFKDPNMSDISMYSAPPIFQPLFGDGLYLSLMEIEDYRDHLVRFWQVLANEMQPG